MTSMNFDADSRAAAWNDLFLYDREGGVSANVAEGRIPMLRLRRFLNFSAVPVFFATVTVLLGATSLALAASSGC